jgi:hypothetical protein
LGQHAELEVPAEVPSSPAPFSTRDLPPDLARVVNAWPRLPEAIKACVLAMIQAMGGANG